MAGALGPASPKTSAPSLPPHCSPGSCLRQPSSPKGIAPARRSPCPLPTHPAHPSPPPVRHQPERQQDHARDPAPHLGADLCLPRRPAGKGPSGFPKRLSKVGGVLRAGRCVSSTPGYCRDLGHRRPRAPSCLLHVVQSLSSQGRRSLRLQSIRTKPQRHVVCDTRV